MQQASSSASQRMQWVDYAKGIGIFLVVLGHTLIGLLNSSILKPSAAALALEQWIYAFHMPLFFFLSGLFIQRSASKRLTDFVLDKLKVIAYPYFVWSVLQSILQSLTSHHTNHPVPLTDLWRIIYQPVMQFWFLYTLFIISFAYVVACKLRASPIHILLLAILFFFLKGYINFGSWAVLYRVQTYAIYLALGALIGSSQFMSKLRLIDPRILLTIVSGGFLIIGLAVGNNLVRNIYEPIPLIALFGISASLALAILMEQFNLTSFVELWGRLSLQIYVVHTMASAMLRIVLQKLGIMEPITHLVLGVLVGIYLSIALEMLCQRVGFQYMFMLNLKKPSKV